MGSPFQHRLPGAGAPRPAAWPMLPTMSVYRMQVSAYVLPRIGAVRLQQLTSEHLSTLYVELERAGGRGGNSLSAKTVRNVHVMMHKALEGAVRRPPPLLARNPTTPAEKPRAATARATTVDSRGDRTSTGCRGRAPLLRRVRTHGDGWASPRRGPRPSMDRSRPGTRLCIDPEGSRPGRQGADVQRAEDRGWPSFDPATYPGDCGPPSAST